MLAYNTLLYFCPERHERVGTGELRAQTDLQRRNNNNNNNNNINTIIINNNNNT